MSGNPDSKGKTFYLWAKQLMVRIFFCCCLVVLTQWAFAQQSGFEFFITASGAKLMDGEREFRFISFNIPNLNYIEDEFGYQQAQPFRLPDAFEIRDALLSARQMGGTVVRLYTIPVARKGAHPESPAYVLGPGAFDEDAFKNLDLVLAIANELGMRVIIPFVNNWQWMGGRPQYADFRDKPHDDFWSDPQLKADLKMTIATVINRKNTLTGVLYKDDKAIFCWETGNELACPQHWTEEICRYIKSLDSQHLVMDGYIAIDGLHVRNESVKESSVDLLSSHHYEGDPDKLIKHIRQNLAIIDGRKPYIIGEFGFLSTSAVQQALDFIIEQPIAGALIWSLRFHRREGGFYWHSEPLGQGLYKAYLWPGFRSGESYDEQNLMALMRRKAFEIRDLAPLPIEVPQAPTLLPIEEVTHISWQGSAGAAYYDLERAPSTLGPWEMAAYHLSDADSQYFPLFNDQNAINGQTYFYRTRAFNQAGASAYSNVVGPIVVRRLALIDNMNNYGWVHHLRGKVSLVKGNDRNFREKTTRMEGRKSAQLTYHTPQKIQYCKIYAFVDKPQKGLSFSFSAEGMAAEPAQLQRKPINAGSNDYGYWDTVIYEGPPPAGKDFQYLHINFEGKVQISRVEVFY